MSEQDFYNADGIFQEEDDDVPMENSHACSAGEHSEGPQPAETLDPSKSPSTAAVHSRHAYVYPCPAESGQLLDSLHDTEVRKEKSFTEAVETCSCREPPACT